LARYVFDFSQGDKDQKDLLGGKGANLAEMVTSGLPAPPRFTISTEACRAYLTSGVVPEGLDAEIAEHLAGLEAARGKKRAQHVAAPHDASALMPAVEQGREVGS
jgi:pyruvate, orthophosphate dikinase